MLSRDKPLSLHVAHNSLLQYAHFCNTAFENADTVCNIGDTLENKADKVLGLIEFISKLGREVLSNTEF